MARRSIQWPPVLSGGRLIMTPDPDDATLTPDQESIELKQIIGLQLLDGTSGNPFNGPIGVDDPTFEANSKASQAQIRGRVRRVFETMERERRARLVEVTFAPTEQISGLSTIRILIVWENLETGGRQQMEQSLG